MAVRVFYQWILMAVPLVALILAVVGLATPNWYKTTVATQSSFTVGYFVVCVSSTATDQCFTYMSYNQVNSLPGKWYAHISILLRKTWLLILVHVACTCGGNDQYTSITLIKDKRITKLKRSKEYDKDATNLNKSPLVQCFI